MSEDRLYLTVGRKKEWNQTHTLYGYIAVISLGQPQLGDERTIICDVEVVDNMKQAKQWFKRMKVERPWEPRH